MNPDTGEIRQFETERETIPEGWVECTPGAILTMTTKEGRELNFVVLEANSAKHTLKVSLLTSEDRVDHVREQLRIMKGK